MNKFYITTSIVYVNAAPHIGYALELVQADAIARFEFFCGKEIFFSTGTDEHGAKIARSAEAARQNVRDFVNENAEKYRNLAAALNLSNSDFIRTSDTTRHFPVAQKLWQKLEDAGDIYKAFYKGLYCVGCEAFITGKDLVEGKCAIHNKEPEIIEEENYFFRLSKYTGEIKSKIENGEIRIVPETRKNEILSLLRDGLEDVSFSRPSRDISWGVPVPGDATQTMYVWCDALSNYISVLGYGSGDESKFNKFWPADLHVIGKDILRFHAAIWPGMLLSAKLSLPRRIFVHGFITVDGKKISKSLGNAVDPFDLINNFGADAFRYYFLSQIPTFHDGDFSRERFREIYNANLANGIGNLVQRTAKMAIQYFDGEILKPEKEFLSSVPLLQKINFVKELGGSDSDFEFFSLPYVFKNNVLTEYRDSFDNFEINKALDAIFAFASQMDKYIDDYKPFKLIKENKEKTNAVLWNLLYSLLAFSILLKPFLPETSEKILKILGKENLTDLKLDENFLKNLDDTASRFKIKSDLTPLFIRV